MVVARCPCGQTWGTCRKHPGEAPAVATFTFERHDGSLFTTYIVRAKSLSDAQWDEAQLYSLENIAMKLIDAPSRSVVRRQAAQAGLEQPEPVS